ncbi:ABC transporter permease [Micromonospora sp. NBC_00362]|uniref:ABC transporter permease n=1 Tax=Micromonospora sp. NBC_00362 TaxID=2975975 RepID=UPI002255E2D9|nr:ABC transporter permease [Micromonospora sp. NBC_00362]MCX5121991.1 ABC transporter permease [Micromonospora sp. NBC_00362]
MRASELPTPSRLLPADIVRVGLVGIRSRPTRAVLSALGIAIGIAAMVAVLGISNAGQADLTNRISRLGTNLLTVSPGRDLFGQDAQLPADAVEMIGRIGPVESVTATAQLSGVTVRRTDRIDPLAGGGIGVAAARTDLLPTVGGSMARGEFLNGATGRYPAVVLGSVAAERLGIDGTGQQVYIGELWFTVTGLLAPVALAPEIDRSALIGWDAARDLFAFDGHPTTVYERSADESVEAVRGVLAATANPQNPQDVRVSRPSDALEAQLAAKSAFTSLFLGLGAVALLVGGVGVANTMVISVLERRPEIGLRRSLGAGRGQIRIQFLAESVALSGSGGTVGVLLGALITAGWSLTQGWPVVMPVTVLLAGVGSAALIGTVAGLYPATRAARLTPTEALSSV